MTEIFDLEKAALEKIGTAWEKVKQGETWGIDFGRIACEWKVVFGQTARGRQTKGTGLSKIFAQLRISRQRAEYWMRKWEFSQGISTPKKPKEKPIKVEDKSAGKTLKKSIRFWLNLLREIDIRREKARCRRAQSRWNSDNADKVEMRTLLDYIQQEIKQETDRLLTSTASPRPSAVSKNAHPVSQGEEANDSKEELTVN